MIIICYNCHKNKHHLVSVGRTVPHDSRQIQVYCFANINIPLPCAVKVCLLSCVFHANIKRLGIFNYFTATFMISIPILAKTSPFAHELLKKYENLLWGAFSYDKVHCSCLPQLPMSLNPCNK